MDMSKLTITVDHSIHEKMGMRILDGYSPEREPLTDEEIKWPVRNEPPFTPKGITLEEAQEAMEKICKIR